jgi:DnaJ-class molecular chaperone
MLEEICTICGGTGITQHLTSLTYGDGSYEDRPCPGCQGAGLLTDREKFKGNPEHAMEMVNQYVLKMKDSCI